MKNDQKSQFKSLLKHFVKDLQQYISTEDGQWSVKGFIDTYKNIYTISADTKIISKILEIHLFPKIIELANKNNYEIVLPNHQNYYPDLSFISRTNEKIKFAVDLKTTYRKPTNMNQCNGFTLGSHGEYFKVRTSTKNIQYPYSSYLGHFCLGIIYTRAESKFIDEAKVFSISQLESIKSVISDLQFFIAEKWTIASDKGGSGNTANIGSITNIDDIINERGMFSKLGEKWFDDYWINYKSITKLDDDGSSKIISNLSDFVEYKKGDVSLVVPKRNKNTGKSP